MPVSDRDREHLRRIGEAKAASHAEAQERHRALPLEERLRRSFELWLAFRDEAHSAERNDDPSPFYDRARSLGLYEP